MKTASSEAVAQSVAQAKEVVLCVDLDGTLVKSDTLLDACCLFLRGAAKDLWRVPGWLAGGKAKLKAEIARRAPLDAARLPYNRPLLRYLQQQRRAGRMIYLATGADQSLAARVARHLGLFDGVLASDGKKNLTGGNKLNDLRERFGSFDYIGNASVDVPLLAASEQVLVANPTFALRTKMRAGKMVAAEVFEDRTSMLRVSVRALRVHQWAKNVLLFVPLLMSHMLTRESIVAVLAAFFCFSLTASANYLVNDLLDIENDRHHKSKRRRPFAAGDLPVAAGVAMIMLLLAAAVAVLPFLPSSFALWLVAYVVATSAYSFALKRVVLVDVLLLSGLYTLRVLAGGAATGTTISPWLAGFSTFLFLSLALVKRFSELENLRERGVASTPGRGYLVADLEQMRSFGTASAYASVVVFCLYITRPDVYALYREPGRLWLIVPLLLLWLSRVWLLASRGEMEEDPVLFAVKDRISLAIGAGVVLVAFLAV